MAHLLGNVCEIFPVLWTPFFSLYVLLLVSYYREKAMGHSFIGKSDIDNKSVENCVCLLRNLSYACQEVTDPDYVRRRENETAASAAAGVSRDIL